MTDRRKVSVLAAVMAAPFAAAWLAGLAPPAPPPPLQPLALATPPGGEPAPESVGVYPATVVKVVDGDTVDADVELPIRMTARARLRLLGINCPEVHGESKEAGLEAKRYTEELIGGRPVIIRASKADAFGRWLADIWVDGAHVNAVILETGHAVPFED